MWHNRTDTFADINVMRMIKLFAWEPRIESQIASRRETELKLIRKGRFLDIMVSIVQKLLPLSTMIVTYAAYVSQLYLFVTVLKLIIVK